MLNAEGSIFNFDPGEFINSKLAEAWGYISYYAGFQWVDPFYRWIPLAIAVVLAVSALAWFFGDMFPVLKPIAGVVVIMVAWGLYVYQLAEKQARAFDANKAKKIGKKKGPS